MPASLLSKKEERKAKNRLTAKKSRDKKNAYVVQLEDNLAAASERVHQLEAMLADSERRRAAEVAEAVRAGNERAERLEAELASMREFALCGSVPCCMFGGENAV